MYEIYNYNGEKIYPLNVIYPENYGAVGDGINDDTRAFKNMLAGGNKTVVLKAKTYKVSGMINLYSNTTIYGNGATIISNRSIFCTGEEGNYAYSYDGTKNVIIRDLTLDINYAGTDHIILAHSENISIINCTFKNNVEHSIELNSSRKVLIDSCSFINVAPPDRVPEGREMEAINIDPAHVGATLSMGYFDNTISDYSIIQNCYFYNCWCPVGNHNETPYASTHIIFKDNYIVNCFRGGQFHSYKDILIKGNFIDSSDSSLRLIGAENVIIEGNKISGIISVESTTKNVSIHDNMFSNAETIIQEQSATNINTHDNIIMS